MRVFVRLVAITLALTTLAGNRSWITQASVNGFTGVLSGKGPLIRLQAGTFDPLTQPEPDGLPALLRAASEANGSAEYWIVQFGRPVGSADREALAQVDATVLDYLPDYAFVVRMDTSPGSVVQRVPGVRWIGEYQPAYRVAPELHSLISQHGSERTRDLVVSVFSGAALEPIIEKIRDWGGAVQQQSQSEWKSKLHVSLDVGQLPHLAALAGVRWIEPAPRWELMNNQAATVMEVRPVWTTHGLYGAGQILGICDTGLDRGSTNPTQLHDDFEDGSGSSRVIAILDTAGDGDTADRISGHGTHVSGSVLGNGVRSGANPSTHTYPDTAYAGIAPEASLVFQAAEAGPVGGLVLPPDLNDLFSQAQRYGVTIHTNSWVSEVIGQYTESAAEVDEFVWSHPGFTIVFAAGNSGRDTNPTNGMVDLSSVNSPATAKNCITVGASENNRPGITSTWGGLWPSRFPVDPIRSDRVADRTDGMAAFSSRGPTQDGRTKPDLVAPGTYVASTRSSVASENGWGVVNDHYMYNGGTSMSAPLVAGAVALTREHLTDAHGHTPSAALLKAILINGANDISPGQYGTGAFREIPGTRPTLVSGWGRVDLGQNLFPDAGRILSYRDEKTGLNTGQVAMYSYQVISSAAPLRITLAWSDYPGAPAAQTALVNDLNLQVTGPGGVIYYPTGGRGPDADHTNNVLGVDVVSPPIGTYEIAVSAFNVPFGPQPYALVLSGIVGNTPPVIATLPNPIIQASQFADDLIDLWAYTWDPQTPNPGLTFQITNLNDPPVINSGVFVDGNRHIDANPVPGWIGQATVGVIATDPDGLLGSGSFLVTVTNIQSMYLPIIAQTNPPPPRISVNPPSGPVGTPFYFTGAHFAPNETISHWIIASDNYRADLDVFQTGSSGSFIYGVTLIGGWPSGIYAYYARGFVTQITAQVLFTVTPGGRTPTLGSRLALESQIVFRWSDNDLPGFAGTGPTTNSVVH